MDTGHILFIAEGQLGDLLLLTPAIRAAKRSFPTAVVSVLIVERRGDPFPGMGPAHPVSDPLPRSANNPLATDPDVDRLFVLSRPMLRSLNGLARVRAELSVIRWLRSQRFGTAICTFPQDRFFFWAFLSGAHVRVGEGGRGVSLLLTHRITQRKSDAGVLAYYCALAEAAGARVFSRKTIYEVPEDAERWAEEVWRARGLAPKGTVVAIHPGASGAYRVWPPEYYASLIDFLQQEKQCQVILCGGQLDREVVEDVRSLCRIPPHVIMINGGVSHLGALLRRCSLCVSNNSGPRHLAVAVGTPSLAIIPRFDDREWKIYDDEQTAGTVQSAGPCPACPPDSCRNTIPAGEQYGSYCMRAISVEDVIARVASLLP